MTKSTAVYHGKDLQECIINFLAEVKLDTAENVFTTKTRPISRVDEMVSSPCMTPKGKFVYTLEVTFV